MRDAAGKAADGFHFLRLPKLLLEGAAFGDVFGEQFEYDPALAAVADRATGDANHGGDAILALPFRGQSFERGRRAQKVGEIEPVVVVSVESEDVLPDQFVGGRVSEQVHECGIDVQNLACGIAAANAVGGVRDQRPEILFRMAEVFLRRAQSRVEPADQHGDEKEQRQADDGGAQLRRTVLPGEREIGADGEGESGGDYAGFPASVPGAYHDGHAEQGEAAFGHICQQNCGD